jgi:hypothetical protein
VQRKEWCPGGDGSRGGERLYSSKKITTKSRCPLTKERIKQLDEMKWGLPFI